MTLLVSMAKDHQAMRRSDIMVCTENRVDDGDGFFVETDYAYTIRTINHLLNEQKAEVALLPCLSVDKGKGFYCSPPSIAHRRSTSLHLNPIDLLPSDRPIRKCYYTHHYYVYTLERILI